jgi:hypothetical protein
VGSQDEEELRKPAGEKRVETQESLSLQRGFVMAGLLKTAYRYFTEPGAKEARTTAKNVATMYEKGATTGGHGAQTEYKMKDISARYKSAVAGNRPYSAEKYGGALRSMGREKHRRRGTGKEGVS